MGQVQRVIALPATGGAPVVIRCTRLTSRMQIQESVVASADVQGLTGNLLTPKPFGQYDIGDEFSIPPSQSLEPYTVAGYEGDHPPHTVPIGNGGSGGFPVSPGGPTSDGTPVVQLTSASASTTDVLVTEWF